MPPFPLLLHCKKTFTNGWKVSADFLLVSPLRYSKTRIQLPNQKPDMTFDILHSLCHVVKNP